MIKIPLWLHFSVRVLLPWTLRSPQARGHSKNVCRDFGEFSGCFRDFPDFFGIFQIFSGFSGIFLDFPGFSGIFRDFPVCFRAHLFQREGAAVGARFPSWAAPCSLCGLPLTGVVALIRHFWGHYLCFVGCPIFPLWAAHVCPMGAVLWRGRGGGDYTGLYYF